MENIPYNPNGRQQELISISCEHIRLGSMKARSDGRALDGQAKLLLAVQGLLGIANALSGTFLPVYLWKASQSLALIGWFNLSQTVVSGITFWLAGKWVKEHNKMNSLRLGVALSGVFYFIVLMLGKSAVTYAVPLGMFNGLSLGSFGLLIMSCTLK